MTQKFYFRASTQGASKQEKKTNIFILMFIIALFTAAIIWKQPKNPRKDDWIMKLWYIYEIEYYAAKSKNEIVQLLQNG